MTYDKTPGNLYWDDHGAQYILCLATKGSEERTLTYPYYQLLNVSKEMKALTLGEHCELYSPDTDINPLERTCCIEFLGRVGKDLMLKPEPNSLLSDGQVRVIVPKQFQACLN